MTEPLNPAERAELERLRGEVEALRTAGGRHRLHWRSVVSAVLIVVGCLLAPVAVATIWVHNQVSDTDRFVATTAPLIEEPTVQAAITNRVTDTVFTYVNIPDLVNEAVDGLVELGLPEQVADRLRGLIGPLTTAVQGFVRGKVAELVSSPGFQEAWRETVRLTHDASTKVLAGEASAIEIRGQDVTLDLGAFINLAKQQLSDAGFTIVNRLPDVHPRITITSAEDLVRAQNAYSALDSLASWLPWVTLALLALGVYVARHHRRALLSAGLGVAASMVLLAAVLLVARSSLINSVPGTAVAPAAASYDILVRFLRDGLRLVFVVGLVVALGAFLTGPSVTAVRVRGAGRTSMTWLRERGAKAGLRTGPVGGWVHQYRSLLRGAALAVAVLVFIFLDQPSGFAVLIISLVLVVLLGVIQLLDQPPGPGTDAARTAS